jgi:tripartite-type tricarboxylate transporter receptor subunit TctC
MKKISAVLITLSMLFSTSNLFAKDWDPTKKPIEIIVPYAPGGGSDRTARLVGDIFTQHGWKNIVVNRPGNNSVLGTNYAAKATPNGYTLFMGGDGTMDANLAFKNKVEGIEYNEDSFTPIIPLGQNGFFLIAPINSPVNSYDEFRNYVRRNPNKFNLGFWNTLEATAFLAWAKLDGLPSPTIINYKGSAPARMDILSGNLDFAMDTLPTTAQLFQAGKLKILAAVTNEGIVEMKALDPAVKITNLAEKYPELNVYAWRGLYAPAGTNPAIIKEINQVINQGLKTKEIGDRLPPRDRFGMGGTPEQLHRIQFNILARYKNMTKYIDSASQ